MTKETATDLVPITKSIVALSGDISALAAAFQENLGGEELSVFDLERIKVPSGGGPAFTVVDPNGDEDTLKELVGTIIWSEKRKAWWEGSTVDGSPPTCRSEDCSHGKGPWGEDGTPGVRLCDGCPYNEFGTAIKDNGELGKGKACKDMRLVFFLREGVESMLPSLVILPPTSIKPLQRYFVSLAAKGIALTQCLTKFELKKEANSEGTAYSQIKPSMNRRLTGGEIAALRQYAEGIKQTFGGMDTSAVETQDIA